MSLNCCCVFVSAQNVDKKYSSPLPFLPDVEQTSSILPLYNQSSLLSSLSISALEEYKGRRLLSELLLPDSGPVALEKKGKGSTLTDKVHANNNVYAMCHAST